MQRPSGPSGYWSDFRVVAETRKPLNEFVCADGKTIRAFLKLPYFAAEPPGAVRVSTSTTTLKPARRRPLSRASCGSAMRTGTRWIILVKLPVAFSGGSSEKTEPDAGAIDSTVPMIG